MIYSNETFKIMLIDIDDCGERKRYLDICQYSTVQASFDLND